MVFFLLKKSIRNITAVFELALFYLMKLYCCTAVKSLARVCLFLIVLRERETLRFSN